MKRICSLVLAFALIGSVCGQAKKMVDLSTRLSPFLLKVDSTPLLSSPQHFFLKTSDIKLLEETFIRNRVTYRLKRKMSNLGIVHIEVSWKDLQHIIRSSSMIEFADIVRVPKEETILNGYDESVNKVNLARDTYPLIQGNNLNVSIKENEYDTTDIDFRGRNTVSGLSSGILSSHATVMATITAGAGNTSEKSRGIARGSFLSSSSFQGLLPDDNNDYRRLKISVQNHSYGTAVENYYGIDALAYDASVIANPGLVHVFSAGNLGEQAASEGRYSNIPGFANLSGSFKMAKNIITVGAVDSLYAVSNLSSRGPAYDGRIKPEVVAFGLDGSSGAAAIVSGLSLLVQELYATRKGTLPPTCLVRAIIFNSADDILSKGVDYRSGFGNVNAYKALKLVGDSQFFIDSTKTNEIREFQINIPENTAEVKIMLCWNDPPAKANAPRALLHDLDLSLINLQTAEEWLPWVLSTFPHADSLAGLPVRTRDSINNAEQVTVTNPAPGKYSIKVVGNNIEGVQPFSVSYQFTQGNIFEWNYPTTSSKLLAGTRELVKFQSNIPEQPRIEWQPIGGAWQQIPSYPGQVAALEVPDINSRAILRATVAGEVYYSDTFSISSIPQPAIGFVCGDSVLVTWEKGNYTLFNIYRLGSRYFEPERSVRNSSVMLDTKQFPLSLVMIEPVFTDNTVAARSFAINFLTQGVACYIKSFLADLENNAARIQFDLGSVSGIDSIILEKEYRNGFLPIKIISTPVQLSYFHLDSNITKGQNRYRLRIVTDDGKSRFSDNEVVYSLGGKEIIVYPNPVLQNQPLRILSADTDETEVILSDLFGRVVIRKKLREQVESLSIGNLPKGLYFYRLLRRKELRHYGRIVVQ